MLIHQKAIKIQMNHICYRKRTLENDTDWTSGERESQSNLLVLTKEKS